MLAWRCSWRFDMARLGLSRVAGSYSAIREFSAATGRHSRDMEQPHSLTDTEDISDTVRSCARERHEAWEWSHPAFLIEQVRAATFYSPLLKRGHQRQRELLSLTHGISCRLQELTAYRINWFSCLIHISILPVKVEPSLDNNSLSMLSSLWQILVLASVQDTFEQCFLVNGVPFLAYSLLCPASYTGSFWAEASHHLTGSFESWAWDSCAIAVIVLSPHGFKSQPCSYWLNNLRPPTPLASSVKASSQVELLVSLDADYP